MTSGTIIHFAAHDPDTLCKDINKFAAQNAVFATQTHIEVRNGLVLHHAYVFYRVPQ